jgi:hypothetical protein
VWLNPVKVIIVGPSFVGGGSEKARMLSSFLQSIGHQVEIINLPGQTIVDRAWYYYQRVRARLDDHEERHMKKTADFIEKRVKKIGCDALICIETQFSYVLARNLSCLKIFSCESLSADELYFSNGFIDLKRFRNLRKMELEIIMNSDYVLFPWETTENYVRKHIWQGNNLVTIRHGCNPSKIRATHFFPPSIVSLGSLGFYWSNRELLSYLTHLSPYLIDVYGHYKPPSKLAINFKGFASSMDVLSNYQFGLNTLSKDIFRQNHFSSRVLTYLSYGLPVLSPDWMKFSHSLKGVLPYNENNFLEIIEEYSDFEKWIKLSDDAYRQSSELDWHQVLKPLQRIIPPS